MSFEQIISQFGEIGAFAALSLFIIWYFIKTIERKDAQMERRDERWSNAFADMTQAITELRLELERHRGGGK